jgi:hypothetical protein
LAQTIDRGDSRNPLEGPFAEKDISTESASHWLEGYKSRDTSEPRFASRTRRSYWAPITPPAAGDHATPSLPARPTSGGLLPYCGRCLCACRAGRGHRDSSST